MTATTERQKQSKIQKLDPAKKVLLHHSILRYLEQNTFSKTLKRFLSEAQVENDDWKASSLDLEDMYCKYIDACCHSEANLKTCKEQESGADGTSRKDGNSDCATTEEITKKKKKKKSNQGDSNVVIDQSKAINKKLPESAKNSGEILADTTVTESEAKSKEKKKRRKDLDIPDQTEQIESDVLNEPADESAHKLEMDESSKNTKDKRKDKKKKDKSKVDSLVERVDPEDNARADAETEGFQPSADATKKEKMSSKKRKRLASDENEDQSTKIETIEESKRRKTKGFEEVKNENVLKEKLDDPLTGNIEMNGGDNSDTRKTARKQRNGSAEPKTVNAFQRVKIDEVEFADDKLQDNSYWAKGGAEVGYGAKAQEVLGQVRGRDFRHEKTKKKRGSYRGGQIDLQSHSVKFNYSDDE